MKQHVGCLGHDASAWSSLPYSVNMMTAETVLVEYSDIFSVYRTFKPGKLIIFFFYFCFLWFANGLVQGLACIAYFGIFVIHDISFFVILAFWQYIFLF